MNISPFLTTADIQGKYCLIYKKYIMTFNVGLFSDTSKARSFKLHMITTLLWVYSVILGLMTLTLFQGRMCVINCKSNMICVTPVCI